MPNYTYDDDEVLKNLFGVRDARTLEELELRFVEARNAEILNGHGPAGQFDTEHLKAVHQHLFQDVYEWAGHTRDERITLADATVASEPVMRKPEGVPFTHGPLIAPALDTLADRLRQDGYLRGLPRAEFAERAADVMAWLNAIHPFREGNGRAQRMFMTELAKEAGHGLDFSTISQERMAQASIAAHERGDNGMMRRMFDEISNPERVAALHRAIHTFDREGFAWNGHYLATTEPGHPVELTMAGVAGDNFMGRTRTEILIGKASDLPQDRPARGEVFTLTPSPWGLVRSAVRVAEEQDRDIRGSEDD